jgi:GTP cyclohydrolase II
VKFHQRGQLDRDVARQRLVQRESGIGVQILLDLGLKNIRVLTNHPRKVVALDGFGLTITEQVGIAVGQGKETHQLL